MRKIIMAIAAAMMMAVPAMAQEADSTKGQPKKDKAAMVEQRTQAMAKRYGLNDKQTKQLMELNEKYAGKMPMGRMGRPAGMRRKGGMQPGRAQRDTMRMARRKINPAMRRQIQAGHGDMMKVRNEYEAELKNIMDSTQFAKYRHSMKQQVKRVRAAKAGVARQGLPAGEADKKD